MKPGVVQTLPATYSGVCDKPRGGARAGRASTKLTEQLPSQVLLDLTMPGCAAIPVVVLTALDFTREDRRRLAGASQILNKGEVHDAGARRQAAPPGRDGTGDEPSRE